MPFPLLVLPTIHTSLCETAATADNKTSVLSSAAGGATTAHAVPFQCMISGRFSYIELPCVPTAHTSSGASAVTAYKTPYLPVAGTSTAFQLCPSQCAEMGWVVSLTLADSHYPHVVRRASCDASKPSKLHHARRIAWPVDFRGCPAPRHGDGGIFPAALPTSREPPISANASKQPSPRIQSIRRFPLIFRIAPSDPQRSCHIQDDPG